MNGCGLPLQTSACKSLLHASMAASKRVYQLQVGVCPAYARLSQSMRDTQYMPFSTAARYITAGYTWARYVTAGYITSGYITAGYITARYITQHLGNGNGQISTPVSRQSLLTIAFESFGHALQPVSHWHCQRKS